MDFFGDHRQKFAFFTTSILVAVCEAVFFKMAAPEFILMARKSLEYIGAVAIAILGGFIVRCLIKPVGEAVHPNPHGHLGPVNISPQEDRIRRRNRFQNFFKIGVFAAVEVTLLSAWLLLKEKVSWLRGPLGFGEQFVLAVIIDIGINKYLPDKLTSLAERLFDYWEPDVVSPTLTVESGNISPVVANKKRSWLIGAFRGLMHAVITILVALCGNLIWKGLKNMFPVLDAENGTRGACIVVGLIDIAINKYLVDQFTKFSNAVVDRLIAEVPPAIVLIPPPPPSEAKRLFCILIISFGALVGFLAASLKIWFWVKHRTMEFEGVAI